MKNELDNLLIDNSIVNLNVSRNEKKSKGITYQDIISNIISTLNHRVEVVVYVDRVIMGSRFKKTTQYF